MMKRSGKALTGSNHISVIALFIETFLAALSVPKD
jgi:hypothetical protein